MTAFACFCALKRLILFSSFWGVVVVVMLNSRENYLGENVHVHNTKIMVALREWPRETGRKKNYKIKKIFGHHHDIEREGCIRFEIDRVHLMPITT